MNAQKISKVVDWIRSEHERWRAKVGATDPYKDRHTIGIHEVLNAHFLLAEYFAKTGEGLGGIGPKNIDLLHSALARQITEFGGRPRWTNRMQIVASLMYGLIKNHPFHDANKRTAFLTSILHLQKIGRTPSVDQKIFEDFTVDIAANELERNTLYTRTSGTKSDREIETISLFLKRNTRQLVTDNKLVTYRELDQILGQFGIMLARPKDNRIDVIRVYDHETGKRLPEPKRIAHIGFHGMSKEVSNKDIEIVRKAAKLDMENGYDSDSFFRGVAGPLALIERYKEPLRRLAYR